MDADTIFIQDNAPIYTSHLIREYFTEMSFAVLDWPPYSPDLNPIKNLWKLLKERICAKDLSLAIAPKNNASLDRLRRLAEEVWDEMDQGLINDLIDSIPRRL